MKQHQFELHEQIVNRPAVLFLGQAYLRMETGQDPLLADILRKYSSTNEPPISYDQLFKATLPQPREVFLSWINERCRRFAPPKWLKVVSSFPWSNVYTSAIDTVWYSTFRSEWRSLYPIYEEKIKPADPRSRTRLQCTFLFGSVDQLEDELNKRPPLTPAEKRKRKQEAIALLRRLPEIITPLGALIIEGYDPNTDWLTLDELLPVIEDLGSNQLHFFSAGDEITSHPDIQDYIADGKILLHRESLASYLNKLDEDGLIQLGLMPPESSAGQKIQIGSKVLIVPSELTNQVSRSAFIVDDSLLAPLPPISKEKNYAEFREFLSESSTRPVWPGYGRGFNFQRNFEDALYNLVDRQLESKTLNEEPIILHGPVGTGKTVALGFLAYKLRYEKRCAVLFVERKPQRPLQSDIDSFCKWAEDNGSPSTVIIWDGMLEVNQYYDLLSFLVSRGRKIVLVGSSYLLDGEKTKKRSCYIEAQFSLSDEFERFKDFLNRIDPSLANFLTKSVNQPDEHFLVALYRVLPPTRRGIEQGVVKEFSFAEQQIMNRSLAQFSVPSSSLAYALYQAGFIKQEDITFGSTKKIDDEEVTEIQELVGMVMVPGRFGIKVPIELLIRSLGKSWLDNLVDILSSVDVFRWYEDNMGNILIGPRHPLEAQLMVQVRLGSPKTEVIYASKLLIEINSSETDSSEIQFAVDLIRAMGPNGLYANYFAPCYGDLANVLKDLRDHRGIENPRLMLQEAALLREWIKNRGGDHQENIQILIDAQKILEKALQVAENESRSFALRSSILVELGTNLAARNRLVLGAGITTSLPIKLFTEAKQFLKKSIAINPNDFHPYDVLFWMTSDLIKTGSLPESFLADVKADLLDAYSGIDPDEFSEDQRENYFERRYQIGQMFSFEFMSDDAFNALLAMGSKSGYYLRALAIANGLPATEDATPEQIEEYGKALQYLESNYQNVHDDSKCLNLLLKLWWVVNTETALFQSERQCLKFSQENWQYLLRITSELLVSSSITNPVIITFLKAVALFHLGDTDSAIELFRETERNSGVVRGKKRIIRSYLVSDSQGNPKEYQGIVSTINIDQNRGEVYIPDIRRRLRFLPLDFPQGRELRRDEPLGPFHIAFNFIGPLADPKIYWTQKGRKP